MPSNEGDHAEPLVDSEPLDDDKALPEEDMGDVDVNNSVLEKAT